MARISQGNLNNERRSLIRWTAWNGCLELRRPIGRWKVSPWVYIIYLVSIIVNRKGYIFENTSSMYSKKDEKKIGLKHCLSSNNRWWNSTRAKDKEFQRRGAMQGPQTKRNSNKRDTILQERNVTKKVIPISIDPIRNLLPPSLL